MKFENRMNRKYLSLGLLIAVLILLIVFFFLPKPYSCVASELEQKIAAEPEPPIPSSTNPITLSRETVTTPAREEIIIRVGIFNPTNDDLIDVNPELSCNNIVGIESESNKKTIPLQDWKIFNILLKLPKVDVGTYNCEVQLKQGETVLPYSKPIKIEIIE